MPPPPTDTPLNDRVRVNIFVYSAVQINVVKGCVYLDSRVYPFATIISTLSSSLYETNLKLDISLDLGPGVALGTIDAHTLAVQHFSVSSHRPHVGLLSVAVGLQNVGRDESSLKGSRGT